MKTFLGIMCILFLLCALQVVVHVPSVRASPDVYIRPDGRVDPSTVPIQVAGNIYTFTDNVYDSIVVQKNGIVIDGAGYVLQSTADYPGIALAGTGLDLSESSSVTVKNLEIKNFDKGIALESSSGNTFSNNRFTSNTIGIDIGKGSNNIVTGNTLATNGYAISLSGGFNNIFSENIMNNNTDGFQITGSELSDFLQSIDTSNLVDGKPVLYLVNRNNMVINSSSYSQVGFLALINCSNVTVEGVALAKDEPSLLIAYSDSVRISGNRIVQGGGVGLIYCSNTLILGNTNTVSNFEIALSHCSNNTITGNNGLGISLSDSSTYNVISGNRMTVNGISLSDLCNYNSISGNTLNNSTGIMVWNCSFNDVLNNYVQGTPVARSNYPVGVYLLSTNCRVIGNNVTLNDQGIWLREGFNLVLNNYFSDSTTAIHVVSPNNTVIGNTVIGSLLGIGVEDANNTIYGNNFIGNNQQAGIGPPWVAAWDNGTAGNYWSDYLTRYPNATEIDNSGIGDTPYVIDASNQDRYPLMKPVGVIPESSVSSPPFYETPLGITVIAVAAILAGVVVTVIFFRRKRRVPQQTVPKIDTL